MGGCLWFGMENVDVLNFYSIFFRRSDGLTGSFAEIDLNLSKILNTIVFQTISFFVYAHYVVIHNKKKNHAVCILKIIFFQMISHQLYAILVVYELYNTTCLLTSVINRK